MSTECVVSDCASFLAVCDPATKAVRKVNPRLPYYQLSGKVDSDRVSINLDKEDAFESCITIARMTAQAGPAVGFALDPVGNSVRCTPLYEKGKRTAQYKPVKGSLVYSIAKC
jgi:hypothetical protein